MYKQIIQQHIDTGLAIRTRLCETYQRYGSDKSTSHNYSGLYWRLFERFKDQPINFMEVGLGTNYTDVKSNMGPDGKPGASLYTISEIYPLWNIVGLDVDTRVLFQSLEKRISTYYVDQTRPDIIQHMWTHPDLTDKQFSIIIDDGLHDYQANINFLEAGWDKVTAGGFYIIEDVQNHQKELFESYLSKTNWDYQVVTLPYDSYWQDNTLVIIQKGNQQ